MSSELPSGYTSPSAVVIGAGFAGLSAALHLTGRRRRRDRPRGPRTRGGAGVVGHPHERRRGRAGCRVDHGPTTTNCGPSRRVSTSRWSRPAPTTSAVRRAGRRRRPMAGQDGFLRGREPRARRRRWPPSGAGDVAGWVPGRGPRRRRRAPLLVKTRLAGTCAQDLDRVTLLRVTEDERRASRRGPARYARLGTGQPAARRGDGRRARRRPAGLRRRRGGPRARRA